ncbi:MAG: hypothetical protein RMZ41_009975 [Nostoc sp. DedVER02]|uniref:hypothetical protein n=1 Tax=unclassified Nostoc TaxID=2593658 RepID=UPI002AD20BFA|nr:MULTISPECIES: hypothetical protein [unclassified Nostoc]MDZ7985713.1 hypothetical protein [Nostoc sp. DedVER02]MDZ8111370.1 hypothetical protein [Nostoc sp. DedVER01b]
MSLLVVGAISKPKVFNRVNALTAFADIAPSIMAWCWMLRCVFTEYQNAYGQMTF